VRSISAAELKAIQIADPPERWEALGFEVQGGACVVGKVSLLLGGPGAGITAWSIDGVDDSLDGLASFDCGTVLPAAGSHPNGAVGIDHVVVVTPDFERTSSALDAAGLGLRRVRDAGGFRQGFRRIGPAILELVEARDAPEGPARFWGLVVIVSDLGSLAARLGDRLGSIRPAVQPGRQIATLRESAGLSTKLAFMDPEGATLA
jgi:hypothetical protein